MCSLQCFKCFGDIYSDIHWIRKKLTEVQHSLRHCFPGLYYIAGDNFGNCDKCSSRQMPLTNETRQNMTQTASKSKGSSNHPHSVAVYTGVFFWMTGDYRCVKQSVTTETVAGEIAGQLACAKQVEIDLFPACLFERRRVGP